MFETSNGIKYEIIGNFGPVYTDVKIAVAPSGEETVIKPVRNRDGREPEIGFAKELKHPNIVIGELLQDKEKNKFLLMPYIKGDALESFANRKDVPLKDKLHRFYEIISDLTEILAYLETLGLSYNDSRFSPQFDRHFIVEKKTGKLKLIDFEQVKALSNSNLRWLHNTIVLIDVVDLLKGSLPLSLQNEFEQELGKLYGKARNNEFENLNELCEELKKLIELLINNSVAAKPLTISNDKGGIDFHALPIETRQIDSLQSLADSPLAINPNLDFEGEWRGIQMVFNAGIRPSARRMAEFAVSASASPLNSRRLEDLRGLVTDLLRRDEEDEKPAPVDPALKELLAIL